VVGGRDLRETPWLGGIGLMATDTEDGGVEFGRLHGGGIVGVFCQWSVAGFTVHVRVPAVFFLVENVGVAGFASLVAGIVDGAGGELGQSVPAVVAVLSKTARNQKAADAKKREDANQEDGCQPEEVSCIFEGIHKVARAALS